METLVRLIVNILNKILCVCSLYYMLSKKRNNSKLPGTFDQRNLREDNMNFELVKLKIVYKTMKLDFEDFITLVYSSSCIYKPFFKVSPGTIKTHFSRCCYIIISMKF